MGVNREVLLTYMYLLLYITLSSGVILYNKWVLSTNYFNFPFPITLTMIHMGFSGVVAFFVVRVFKIYDKCGSDQRLLCLKPLLSTLIRCLFGNTAYLHISVAFIQMLKALMPVATFLVAIICGTDKLRCDIFLNMVLISAGVIVSSYGEIQFNVVGTVFQVTGIIAEALRLVLTQVLIQKKGLTLNPITSLYYIAPCSFLFLFLPWYWLEQSRMEVSQIQFNFWIFLSNAVCALALNFSVFLVIGRTGAVTIRVAGVLKDWILIALSTVIFPESMITFLNAMGYAIALCGVVIYNYLKTKDVSAPINKLPVKNISTKTDNENKSSAFSDDSVELVNNSGKISSSYMEEKTSLLPSSKLSL
ncbi:Phosphate translocator-like protein [Zostera marina]|uniref:Phosphate translocator-like protein n=1 Tax=Zostera marina TaxID=29655 RepID=A0A0K9P194_ZOSMR|nr:Phosphate translocator-like protein [Zostera marina]